MANSSVSIANRALQKLGARRIESLTQDHKNARAMNVAYEPVKRKLLRSYDWAFAIKRASVAALSAQTDWGSLNQFPVPNDFIRLLVNKEIDDTLDASVDYEKDWKIEGRNIITADSAPLQFRYISDVIDPTLHDACFDEALAAALAYECCEELTQSNQKKVELKDDVKQEIRDAKRLGFIEKGPMVQVEADWLNERL